MARREAQTFNDGLCVIYKTGNTAQPGEMPVDGLTPRGEPLRYQERIVGMMRYYTAMQSDTRVDMLLRMPRKDEVSRHDIVMPRDGAHYDIVQIQYPTDVDPPVMDLSLSLIATKEELEGADGI